MQILFSYYDEMKLETGNRSKFRKCTTSVNLGQTGEVRWQGRGQSLMATAQGMPNRKPPSSCVRFNTGRISDKCTYMSLKPITNWLK